MFYLLCFMLIHSMHFELKGFHHTQLANRKQDQIGLRLNDINKSKGYWDWRSGRKLDLWDTHWDHIVPSEEQIIEINSIEFYTQLINNSVLYRTKCRI